MRPRRTVLAACCAAAVLAAGCTSDDDADEQHDGPLPEADPLVSDAADAAAEIESTHFQLAVEGSVPGLAVNDIDGDLTTEGDDVAAEGTATLGQDGQSVELTYVLHDGTLYLDGMPGGRQEIPEEQASMVYDFSAVLDPDRGVAELIGSMSDAETVDATEIAGTDTYQIDGTVPRDALTGLVPDAESDVDASLWVSQDGHDPIRASATFADGEQNGTLSVTLSDVNEPVDVQPPD